MGKSKISGPDGQASSAMIELGHNQMEGKSLIADSTTKAVGVNLSKQVFAICETNRSGHIIQRMELRRAAFCHWLLLLSAGTLVAMGACSGGHQRMRFCLRHGLQARLMATQFAPRSAEAHAARTTATTPRR